MGSRIEEQMAPGQMLLVDSMSVQLQLVEDAQGKNKLLLRGEFARSDKATENKRLYGKQLWEREIVRLEKSMSNRQLFGELDHPSDGRTQLKRASHIVTNLSIDNNTVVGEAEVLDTDAGRNLKALLNSNCRIGVSSRGYGSVKPDGKGNDVVQEDYKLVTFDFVADPADGTAYPEVVDEGKKETLMGKKLTAESEVEDDKSEETDESEGDKDAAVAAALEQGREEARQELRGEFAKQLVDEIKKAKESIREAVRVEFLEDPSIGSAKQALNEVKNLLRPYVLPSDVETILAERDGEVAKLTKQLQEKDLQIAELEEDVSKLAALAREVGYKHFLENQISGEPDAEEIRQRVGDVTAYEDAAALKGAIDSVRSDLHKKREEEAEERAAQEKADEEAKEKASKLESSLEKSLTLNKRLAVKLYAEQRLTNHPKAAKIRSLVESAKPSSQEEVDEIVEQFDDEPRMDADELDNVRSRVRRLTRGGFSNKVIEESSAPPQLANGDYNGLGVPLTELKKLSGTQPR